MSKADVIMAIAATAELCGKTFSQAAAAIFADDLAAYPEESVLKALSRCRKELKGSLTVADVVSRIDDGRPGMEAAWAMLPKDEDASVVWTDEMAQAWGVAKPLIQENDRIGARMAFKESYEKLVSDSRNEKRAAKWVVSLGRDVIGQQSALIDAVMKKRLPLNHALKLLPQDAAEGMLRSLNVTNHPLLETPDEAGQKKIKELLLTMKSKSA